MKTKQAIQTLLTLGAVILAASSQGQPLLEGQTLLYDNGPVNGTGYSLGIQGPSFVIDSFTLGAASTVSEATVGIWNSPGDSLNSLQWSLRTSPFGGTTLASGTSATTDTFLFQNSSGYSIYSDSFSITPTALAAGTYWFQLDNAVTAEGENAFWDINGGPSTAFLGIGGSPSTNSPPSESFQLYGTITNTPEPSAMALALVGALSFVCLRRRK